MKHFYWNKVPLVRILLPFAAGIVSAVFVGINIPVVATLAFIFLSATVVLHFSGFVKNNYSRRWIFGLVVNLFFLFSGNLLTSFHIEINDEKHFSNYAGNTKYYIGYLYEPLKEGNKSYKTEIEITAVKTNDEIIPVKGKLLAYLQKDSTISHLNYGDVIIFKAKPQEIKEPQNPYEFNYKRFLSFKQIYQQVYIKGEDIRKSGSGEGNFFISKALETQQKLLQVFKDHNITGKEYSVLSALMLGYKDELDGEIKQAYSSSGAMHVLAVSGLHVGIIFLAISKFLFFMEKKRWQIILRGIIIILFLWSYAFITGLSPSVMRSATMLSFVVGAGMLSRESNIYNTLAASALVLLLIDPFLIMAVGFQLSYLAVIGIVAIQPKIYNLIYPKNWLIRQAWAITCVSIAAQLATFPLGMLYYHQFPNYFLFSNLLVIPAATIILYSGLTLFLFSSVPILSVYIAKFVNGAVWVLNESVFFIERLPHALTQGISHTVFDTWVIYAMIFSVFLSLLMKCKRQLITALSLMLVFSVFTLNKNSFSVNRKKIVVFNINGTKAYNFISGNEHVFIADSLLVADKEKMIFHVNKYWDNEGLKKPVILYTHNLPGKFESKEARFFIKNNFIQFGDKRIAIKSDESVNPSPQRLDLDYIIYTGKKENNISALKENYDFNLLILDSSRPDYLQEKIKQQLASEGINYYCVKEKGYLELNL